MKYNLKIPFDVINPNIILDGEEFEYITDEIVSGVYPYYMISSYGRVYHRYLESFMKPGLETSGYLFITLSTNSGPRIIQLNRLVLMTFNPISNMNELQANHINGIKTDNRLINLEWTTRSENIIHAYRTGLHKPVTTISEDQAQQVVNMLKENNLQCKEIAKILNINENIVNSIKKKESWKHLTQGIEFESRKGRLYTDEFVNKLCIYFETHKKPIDQNSNDFVKEALTACGSDNPDQLVDTARKIYSKKHYTRISKNYNF